MDLYLKKGVQIKVPVMLISSSTKEGLSGIQYSDAGLSVHVHKQGAVSTYQKSLTASNWVEIDNVNFPGVYDLELSQTDTDTSGWLKVSVKQTGSFFYTGVYPVSDQIVTDNYNILNFLSKALYNKSEVVNDSFILYDDNGTTKILEQDLYDDQNQSTSSNIYKRVPNNTYPRPS